METYLNGRLVQEGSTADLVFGVPELVSFASEVMTLLPGDIIATGTPGGIGPMQVGDTVEVKIEAIGTLRNYVVE
jgi:2-keto-4-pentenoate hydratase/2-oxohepta-3-ene-1,7-dioic acid hydratase in catechol pathway